MTSRLLVDKIEGKASSGTVQMPAGHIIQTVSTQHSGTAQSSTSASFVALTNLSVSITPKFSTSKILIMTDPSIYMSGGQQDNNSTIAIYRDGSEVMSHSNRQYDYGGSGVLLERPFTMFYVDSPSTTNSITYQLYATLASTASGHLWILNDNANDTSSLIVQEIAQ